MVHPPLAMGRVVEGVVGQRAVHVLLNLEAQILIGVELEPPGPMGTG